MKKFFLLMLSYIFLTTSMTFAATYKIKAEALNSFSTANPEETLKVKILDDYEFGNGIILPRNSEFNTTVFKIRNEKIGKLDAALFVKINSATIPTEKGQKTVKIKNEKAIAKVSVYDPKTFDMIDFTLDTGATVAGLFVKNLTYPINFARGIVMPDEECDSRLESGFKTMYKKSIFSYVEKGDEVEFKEGELIVLTVKLNDENTTTVDENHLQENNVIE